MEEILEEKRSQSSLFNVSFARKASFATLDSQNNGNRDVHKWKNMDLPFTNSPIQMKQKWPSGYSLNRKPSEQKVNILNLQMTLKR